MKLRLPSLWVHRLVRCLLLLQSALLCCQGASPCPKLQFLSEAGCRPCSLCERTSPQMDVRSECRRGNPDPLPDGRVLWCDFSKGPFPECPALHPSVKMWCSESCRADWRQFAPGCECIVGCAGQPPLAIHCTHTLQWNTTLIPPQCASPTTTPPDPAEDEPVAPTQRTSGDSQDDVVMTIALGSLVGITVLVITVAIIGTCLYRRLQERLTPPPSSGASAAPLLHGGEGSQSSSSDERAPVSSSTTLKAAESGAKRGADLTEGVVVVEVTGAARETPDTATEIAGVQQREVGREMGGEDQLSARALGGLLKSRGDLQELSRRFDQQYAFDRVTWHDVAVDLLGWDSNDMHHMEYRCRPSTGSPGDGPMYQVLERALQEGRGLLDLIHCLRRQRKAQGSHPHGTDTEQVLTSFWQRWKSQHTS